MIGSFVAVGGSHRVLLKRQFSAGQCDASAVRPLASGDKRPEVKTGSILDESENYFAHVQTLARYLARKIRYFWNFLLRYNEMTRRG
jgi:hypothetical protein